MSFIKQQIFDRFEGPGNPDPRLTPCLYKFEELNIGRGLFADGVADIDIERTGDWYVLRVFLKGEDKSGGIDDSSWTKSEFERELFKMIATALRRDCADDIQDACLNAGRR